MDFSNEHYVRLYTRDTTTWKLLGWDGQNVLSQVLRKLDTAGVMELEGLQPWEAVVIHCGAPESAAREGMRVCLERGVLVHNGQYLVAPKFREAQESTKSDKQRQKESRERRAIASLVPPDPNVTRRDAVESQDVTVESRDVMKTSQPVTVGHKLSLSAVQCSSSASAVQCNTSAVLFRAREESTPLPEDPPELPAPELRETPWLTVWRVYETVLNTGSLAGYGLHRAALETIADAVTGRAKCSEGEPFEAAARIILRAWLADPWVAKHGPPIENLARNLHKFLGASAPSVASTRGHEPFEYTWRDAMAAGISPDDTQAWCDRKNGKAAPLRVVS